ncbi:hypothetical protein [Lysinibacillus odysseyi]|uniref:hypothetical protein n=1 Tax=Lysinibacillus odysseyi TaxID=202611 RepID=UPI00055E2925|nr:hypothetical protein [Lysinibacillus odysseyi]
MTIMTADELLKAMDEMENEERIKLLDVLFHKNFDNRPPKEVLEKERYRALYPEDVEDEPLLIHSKEQIE